MFAISGAEGLLLVLWLLGVVSAAASYSQGRRGLAGVLLLAAALVVPVLGSLLAVGVFATIMRDQARRADHPVT